MDTSLDRVRAKIAELEAKLADLRITERELEALELTPGRKTRSPRVPKLASDGTKKAAPPARQTISGAIADVLGAHGALPAAEIAEYIQAAGRDIGNRSVSHSLQALKKQGRVKIRGGKWMLPKARSRRASA
jgi:hypothetical protein